MTKVLSSLLGKSSHFTSRGQEEENKRDYNNCVDHVLLNLKYVAQ